MIRHLRPFAPAVIFLASFLLAQAQSEPAALPVQPVRTEPQPQPEPAKPPSPQKSEPALAKTPVVAPADDSKARISKLESDLAAARAQLKTAKSHAAAASGRAKDDRAHAAAELGQLKSQLASVTAERDRLQSSLDQAKINLASATERLGIYEKSIHDASSPDVEELRAALNAAQQKVDMTVRAFEIVQAENNRIRAQMKDADPEQVAEDLKQTKLDLAEAQRQLTAEKYRSNNLARELARAKPGAPVVIDESIPSAPTRPSEAPELAPEAAQEIPVPPPADAKIHTVADGETLSGIAKQYYGSASRWIDIFNANRDVLQDANHVTPGTKLRIP